AQVGAIHFSLDPELINALRRSLSLATFVETGTFNGDTTASVAPLFARVFTVELSVELHRRARDRLAAYPNVRAIEGSSPAILRSLRTDLSASGVLYWLDAHWCGEATAGQSQECPLLSELEAIGTLNDDSVVLIDDARFFTAPAPAPHNPGEW